MFRARGLSSVLAGVLAAGVVLLGPAAVHADTGAPAVTTVIDGSDWSPSVPGDIGGVYGATAASLNSDLVYGVVWESNNWQLPYRFQLEAFHPGGAADPLPLSWTYDGQAQETYPVHLATDAQGSVYALVGDASTDSYSVAVLRPGATAAVTLPFPHLTIAGSGCAADLAVSAAGDVYVSNSCGEPSSVMELPAGASQPHEVQVEGMSHVQAMDVDRAGNLYVAGYGATGYSTFRIAKYAAGSSTGSTLAELAANSGFIAPDDLAVAGGEVFMAAASSIGMRLSEVPVQGGSVVVLAELPGDPNTFGAPAGDLSYDGRGSLYAAGYAQAAIYRLSIAGTVVASDSTRSVPENDAAGVELSASDPSGGDLTYAVTTPPSHGTLSGVAPHLTYTPAQGYTGPDSIGWSVSSSGGGSATATVSIDVSADGTDSVAQTVVGGQSVATGSEVTDQAPEQAQVTSPVAGDVSITTSDDAQAPAGYGLVGTQYVIHAPPASVDQPLSLTFLVSASALPPGQDASDVTIFRDGAPIASCADASGTATPDPCVSSRTTDGGTITIDVLSSHASTWTTGVLAQSTATTLAATPTSSTYGDSVRLRATVTAGSTPVTSGDVTFSDGSATLGQAPVDAAGVATMDVASLAPGVHHLLAHYGGDTFTLSSDSSDTSVSVARIPTTLTADPAVAKLGPGLKATVTVNRFAAHLKRADTGAAVAGATVVFRAGTTTLCTGVTDASGTATCSGSALLSLLTGGFTASYAGDGTHLSASAKGAIVGVG